MMPDLFNYWLTGVARSEMTIASTSQFYNPRGEALGDGAVREAGAAGVDSAAACGPGHGARTLVPSVAEAAGLRSRTGLRYREPRYSVGGGGCSGRGARLAVYQLGNLVSDGSRTREPVINDAALAANLTNEIGAAGKVRLLKNIAGLWLLQECRRAWALEGIGVQL